MSLKKDKVWREDPGEGTLTSTYPYNLYADVHGWGTEGEGGGWRGEEGRKGPLGPGQRRRE